MKLLKNVFILVLIPFFLLSSCSEDAKVLFKLSGYPVKLLTDAEGKIIHSDTMKTNFSTKFIYNKYNLLQKEAIESERYVNLENGKKGLIKIRTELDVYGQRKYSQWLSPEGIEIGVYDIKTSTFKTCLPYNEYGYDGKNINLKSSSKASSKHRKLPTNTNYSFNRIYSENFDSILLFPTKNFIDTIFVLKNIKPKLVFIKQIGITKIKIGEVSNYLPYLMVNTDVSTEMFFYDKVPDSMKTDFNLIKFWKLTNHVNTLGGEYFNKIIYPKVWSIIKDGKRTELDPKDYFKIPEFQLAVNGIFKARRGIGLKKDKELKKIYEEVLMLINGEIESQ